MQTRALAPLVLINAVGLTGRLLAHAPRLRALAEAGWLRSVREVIPAVTCTAQASLLTGFPPSGHGIVGNGWLFRETGEVRFWQQANALIQAEPLYKTAARLAAKAGRPFRSAQLFWWFNQGAAVDISVTPKPYYGADGNKAFGITGTPDGLTERLERELGPFPFRTFWGPGAGLPCTAWIARCAASLLATEPPDLSLVYLPHLDYEPQRQGPTRSDMARLVGELDEACVPLLDAARRVGARVWVVSEYGHCDVSRPILINRLLRGAGLLVARDGPFGEVLDTFQSRAFAVCDHQLAHVYVRDAQDIERVRDLLLGQPGMAQVLAGDLRREWGLDHPRSGELIALSEPDAWFAYPYWLDDRRAPDFARTVDIHRKPGYDPCELFFDPALRWPQGRAMIRLAQKKLGFRTLFDLIPLDATLVRGSHGLHAATREDRPILIGDGPAPSADETIEMVDAHGLLLRALVPEAE
ncbi:nucleotide pyrophosphatase/phosphodiesterase family protein [Singulisphaera sp. Ch08]|uniref:Nucleotide pyrophosphatase/phosphodiesterase family protein n=1 Tax=Singulisphaera sp. Ch08 TaxID=3120278 RepID=A0AAU7CNK9_9BACT